MCREVGGHMKQAGRLATLPAWSRREFLRSAGLTIAGLTLPPWLSGCGDGSDGGSPASDAATQAQPLTVDPGRAWWLQNGFDPVAAELEVLDLPTRGHIPPELSGVYVRNGSNPQSGSSPNWFFGDGMLHSVRLEGGRAVAYRNRYVRTPRYLAGEGFDTRRPPTADATHSNAS